MYTLIFIYIYIYIHTDVIYKKYIIFIKIENYDIIISYIYNEKIYI